MVKKAWCVWQAKVTLPGHAHPHSIWLARDFRTGAYREARIVAVSVFKAMCGDNPLVQEASLKTALTLSLTSKTTSEQCPQLLQLLKDASAISKDDQHVTLTSVHGVARAMVQLKGQVREWKEVIASFRLCTKTAIPAAARQAVQPASAPTTAGTSGGAYSAARPADDIRYDKEELYWTLGTPFPVRVPEKPYTEKEIRGS
jgi:hypothetical protein